MSPEERPEQVEAVDEFVDALIDGRRPERNGELEGADGAMLRVAALLASADSPRSQPSAAFVEELRGKFDDRRPRWWDFRIGRRGFAGGLAAGVSALAALVIGRGAWQRFGPGQTVPAGWVPVAQAADLSPGTIRPFAAGDVQGHVMNIGGKIWALSAVCTHMACMLQWQPQRQDFLCPCHGAEFDTTGQQTGAEAYGYNLKPLSRIPVQQLNGTIYFVPS